MILQCPTCSKINPADARYCFYDGRPLSKERQDGPLQLGTMPFPMPFCFADGQRCDNFNQLALACSERWDEARSLLAEGYWPTFFGGIGRLDLAVAAKQAAGQSDRDLGLSQLLEKFPADADALRPAKVALDSPEKDLGQLVPGKNHNFELTIINQGMLFLTGSISLNSDWLVFGDQSGLRQKLFQTRNFCTIRVRVLGSKLRAGLKPLEGEIVIETNGGTITLPVRGNVPILPFPKGPNGNDALTGAASPREVALKAKAFPNEAALLFEQGAVKAWYASNGWAYPIEGGEGSGKGAVQQFFEALGLAKPPRLKVDVESLSFAGKIGERLTKTVTVGTDESKPVYAHAWSDHDWIQIGPPRYFGSKVKIDIEVVIPQSPGQIVQAQVYIQGNGQQQFLVAVSVAVDKEMPSPAKKPVNASTTDGEAVDEPEPSAASRTWLFASVGGVLVMMMLAMCCLVSLIYLVATHHGTVVAEGEVTVVDQSKKTHILKAGPQQLPVGVYVVEPPGAHHVEPKTFTLQRGATVTLKAK